MFAPPLTYHNIGYTQGEYPDEGRNLGPKHNRVRFHYRNAAIAYDPAEMHQEGDRLADQQHIGKIPSPLADSFYHAIPPLFCELPGVGHLLFNIYCCIN